MLRSSANTQCGIALVAVLWLVAALSVMLIGLQHVVRGEIRMTGQAQNRVVYGGIADAAIRLALTEMVSVKNLSEKSVRNIAVKVFGQEVKVQIVPLNGLIDLNTASEALLADAYEYAAGLPISEALKLAGLTVEARERRGPDAALERFHAVEDLLRIEGVSFDTHAKMKLVATTDIVGNGHVNPLAASTDTLVVLAKGDRVRALQLAESRQSNPESMDATTLTAPHLQTEPTSYLAVSATVAPQGDVSVTRTWRVDMSTSVSGVPWRVLGVDQRISDPRIFPGVASN